MEFFNFFNFSSLTLYLIPLIFVVVCILVIWILIKTKIHQNFIVSANPNEWILIVGANGQLKKANIGITSFVSPFDKCVKFPSQIHKLTFLTDQVDKNMQGISIGGLIVWSIYRNEDGPFKAYKYLGEDIKSKNPVTAQDNLKSMSESIVRHCIANSTIQDILVNRNFIRDQIRKDMLEVVKGWGIWLETVEITEVRILSQTLFKNLQTKFREENNEKAQKIIMESNQNIYQHELQIGLQKTQVKEDKQTKEYILKNEHELKRLHDNEKCDEEKVKLEQATFKRNQDYSEFKEKLNEDLKRKKHQLTVETKLINFKEDAKSIEAEKEVANILHQFTLAKSKNGIEVNQLTNDFANKKLQEEMELKTKFFDNKNMQYKMIQSYQDVYKTLPVKEIKMVNMFGQQDSIGNGMMQFIGAFQEMSKQFKTD